MMQGCRGPLKSISRAVVYLRQMGADKRQRANILGETARRLFGLR